LTKNNKTKAVCINEDSVI